MTTRSKQLMLVFAGVLLATALSTFAITSYAHAHDGEDHGSVESAEHALSTLQGDERIEYMQALIPLLEELRDLLTLRVEQSHSHAHETEVAALSISVEEHGGRTHIHVYENDVQTDAFFLDDLSLTQEDAIITAIADQTGFTEMEIRNAVNFPDTGHAESEHGAHEEHGDEEMDLSSIHIMSDGTVMLGDGTVLADATVHEDGTIELPDGSLVEPELDMR